MADEKSFVDGVLVKLQEDMVDCLVENPTATGEKIHHKYIHKE